MMHPLPVATESLTDDERSCHLAYNEGLELSKLLGLLVYFLKHTPEGRQVRRELEADWQTTIAELKTRGEIRGAQWSCSQWLKQLRKELLSPKNGQAKAHSFSVTAHKKTPTTKLPPTTKKFHARSGLKFRGIK